MRPISRQVALSNGLLNWLELKHYFEKLNKTDKSFIITYTPEQARRWDWEKQEYKNESRQAFHIKLVPYFVGETIEEGKRAFSCIKYEDTNDFWFRNCVRTQLINLKLWNEGGFTRGEYGNSLVDVLYYKIHPEKLKYKYRDGRLTRGFWNHLTRRMNGFACNSRVTEYLFKYAVRWCKKNVSKNNQTIKEYLESKGLNRGVFWGYCFISKKWFYGRNNLRTETISGKERTIHSSIILSNYGYKKDERFYQWHLPDEIIVDGECYKQNEIVYEECISCGHPTIESNLYDGECYDCLPSDYKIQGYSTRAEELLQFKARRVKLQKGKDLTQYFGIELEYEVPNKTRKAQLYVLKQLFDHCIMKYDGSIGNGFEITTCPATIDIHKERIGSFLDNLPPEFDISSRTGMHIHISKASMSRLGIAKFTEFMNRTDNQTFIRKIAGRQSNTYQHSNERYNMKYGLKNTYFDRYNNVNLNNRDTIEVRIFSTPKTKEDFNIKLEFCKALADYCQPGNQETNLTESTKVKSFVDWLKKVRYDYKNLFNFIQKEIPSCV